MDDWHLDGVEEVIFGSPDVGDDIVDGDAGREDLAGRLPSGHEDLPGKQFTLKQLRWVSFLTP